MTFPVHEPYSRRFSTDKLRTAPIEDKIALDTMKMLH
jgi:hypothetical protein